MTDPDTAQASVLIAALQDQLVEMVPQLERAEHEASIANPERARAVRLDAAQLLRDVSHARFLITQLQHRFPAAEMTVRTLVTEFE